MRFTVLQDNIKRGLAIISHAVAVKTPLPVLSNVLLTARDGVLELSATDLTIGIKHKIGAMVEVEGAITLPAKLLADVIGGMPNDKVFFDVDTRKASAAIKCGRFASNIKGIDADEFPTIPATDDNPVHFDGRRLAAALKRVAFCAADEDSRPVLAGVLFQHTARRLMLAAADGYRAAVEQVPTQSDDSFSLIIPKRAIEVLARLMVEAEGITMASNGAQVSFTDAHGSTTLVSRLIDGAFPDVQRIIPQHYLTRTIVDVAGLAKAVKLAGFFAASSQNVLKLTSSTGEPGKLVVSANAAEVGDNTGEVEALVTGDGGAIAVNVKYLAELLAASPMAQIAIETQAPSSPLVVRPVGFDGEYVSVIMPMAIR